MGSITGSTVIHLSFKQVYPNLLSSRCLARRLQTDKKIALLLSWVNKQHISMTSTLGLDI